MPEPASVAVVVLNWNGNDDTVECLRSLGQLDYPKVEIVLVDNGSVPPAAQLIGSQFPGVTCIQLDENLGYSGGNNAGIEYALQKGHDFVWVLNNDTIVTPSSLRAAVEMAESDPRIAAVGVKILAMEDPKRVWVAYGQVNYRQSLVHLSGYFLPDDGSFDEPCDVEWVPGTALLLRRRALEEIGGFDDRFFAYHEDVDWCTLARERGYRIVFAPQALIYHKGHASSGGRVYVSPRQYLAGRNMVLYVRKHANLRQRLKFAAFVLGTLPAQYLRRLLTGEHHGVVLKVRGMLDGLRDRPIPLEELGLRPPKTGC
jgi:GT2 family glycosyltransferase